MIPPEQHAVLIRELAAKPAGILVTCAGRSMEPTVRLGQKVLITGGKRLRVGDVVLFETSDRSALVLHRIVALVPGTPFLLHLGDAPGRTLPGITRRDRVLGTAIEFPRRLPTVRVALAAVVRVAQAAWRSSRRALG